MGSGLSTCTIASLWMDLSMIVQCGTWKIRMIKPIDSQEPTVTCIALKMMIGAETMSTLSGINLEVKD